MQQRKAIISEDEPLVRAELKEMLTRLWPELSIAAGERAVRTLVQSM